MNRPCPVNVVIQPGGSDGKGGFYKDSNKISAFNVKRGNQPQPQAPVAQPVPQAVAPQAQPQAAAPQAGPAINWSQP